MSIVLFAIIGATMKAGLAYWICFSLYCSLKATKFLLNFFKFCKESEED